MAKKEAKFVRLAATIEWAYLAKPNDMSGKYEFDATRLAPKAVKALEDVLGIQVKVSEEKPEKGSYIKLRSARPIRVYDEDGDEIDNATVGNGTKAILTIGAYDWTFKAKSGTSPTCKKFIVTDLVVFGEGFNEEEVEEVL